MVSKLRGRHAAKSGKHNEDVFQNMLELHGVPFTTQFDFPHPWSKRSGKGDFLLLPSNGSRIVVQNKNQTTSGTTDEKIPFQFDIARWAVGGFLFDEFWIVLGGQFWRTDAGRLRIPVYERLADEFNAAVHGVTAFVYMHPSREIVEAIKKL